jgi:hypothetical protein
MISAALEEKTAVTPSGVPLDVDPFGDAGQPWQETI